MDTNQNVHINLFTDGVNTDTSYSMISEKQYTMSLNHRISTIKYDDSTFDSTYSNQKEGLLAPVQIGKYEYKIERLIPKVDGSTTAYTIESYNYVNQDYVYKILTSGSTSIILYKNYKYEENEKGEQVAVPVLNVARLKDGVDRVKYVRILFCVKLSIDLKNISAVLNEEIESVTNLYIATGNSQLLQVNVLDEDYIASLFDDTTLFIDIDYITSNSFFPYDKLTIADQIYGQLKTSQIQYTYRFYKKYGICSKLAPLTNKIQVINPDKTQETGCAEDTVTCTGFKLKIDEDILKKASKLFDRLQIYRISYIKVNTDAEVKLLFDGKFDESFQYNDIKQEGIQELTMEEFSNISGLSLYPNIISQNQKYLFCGDVTDKTIINFKDFGNVTEDEIKTWYRTYRISNGEGSNTPKLNGKELPDTALTQEGLYNYIFSSNSSSGVDYNYIGEYDKVTSGQLGDEAINYLTECCDLESNFGGVGRYIKWSFIFTGIPSGSISTSLHTNIDVNSVTPYTSFYLRKFSNVSSSFAKFDYNLNAKYLQSKHIEMNAANLTGGYENNILSSMFRSLRRNEVYRYGIVFYDKYGNRTNVFWIQDIKTPAIIDIFGSDDPSGTDTGKSVINLFGLYGTPVSSNNLYSISIGIKFDVKIPNELKDAGIIGYEIVRCEKNVTNTKNIYQTVISRPVQQITVTGSASPYYPTGFITTQPCRIVPGQTVGSRSGGASIWGMGPKSSKDALTENLSYVNDYSANVVKANVPQKQIFQLFCPEYYIYNKDVLNNIKQNSIKLAPQCYLNPDKQPGVGNINKQIYSDGGTLNNRCEWVDSTYEVDKYITIDRRKFTTAKEVKTKSGIVLPMTCSTNAITIFDSSNKPISIKYSRSIINFNDSKNPTWSDGFSNVKVDGDIVKSGVMQYQTFVTNASTYTYLNWVCSGKYGYPIGANDTAEKPGGGWTNGAWNNVGEYQGYLYQTTIPVLNGQKYFFSEGIIGPSGPCIVAVVDMPGSGDDESKEFDAWNKYQYNSTSVSIPIPYFGTFLCNLQHEAVQFSGLTEAERQYDTYYGFGNYVHVSDDKTTTTNIVFDGDVYPDLQEIYTMFKAWDFNDTSAYLQSTQILYYIPMESTVNWRFDYGMNYKNTGNKNLQLEPGEITGVSSQERPLRQYNSIYSDNNTSNDIYNVTPLDDSQNTYRQRLFYSELKTPGENIDNWQIFKSTNCIDCNSEYGSISDMYTFKDTLYVWQEKAFSKLSVNERSLVKDENSNTIQLGQGEVLQRVDYISTNYGMRLGDMCKVNAEGVLYWFDFYNTCIAALTNNAVVDYTNAKNIKSLIKTYTDHRIPQLTYDSSHKEVLFGTIKSPLDNTNTVLVLNAEQNIPMGLYTINKSNILQYDKDCISISNTEVTTTDNYSIYSGAIDSYAGNGDLFLLTPTYIQFVVNTNPSVTKVFDNQQIVTGKRNINYDNSESGKSYFDDKYVAFITDICDTNTSNDEIITTDREGSIKYAIPRYNPEDGYGNRMRGKYMLESITDNNPNKDSTISHIITKYRTSYN